MLLSAEVLYDCYLRVSEPIYGFQFGNWEDNILHFVYIS